MGSHLHKIFFRSGTVRSRVKILTPLRAAIKLKGAKGWLKKISPLGHASPNHVGIASLGERMVEEDFTARAKPAKAPHDEKAQNKVPAKHASAPVIHRA
ncbi:hypothetical protein [Pyrinomonas methylaliphatogenes]|jgi:hypothetical protein|uniref:hypothetical protein n=1 Tax=Pyrinomonas methylaliphatogenes TaxID=454194 RepID=UPI0005A99737|nr:hypothetical protein [Pyrinomonas methylaliphatogenes]